jgi:membrane-associated phospholipid phosphatase
VKVAGLNLFTVAQDAVNSVNPIAFAPLVLLLAILASQRGRPPIVAAIAMVLVGSILSSAALKSAIGEHSAAVFGVAIVGGPSFPSDHATASMALVLCVLFASPREWGGLVTGVGGLYVLLAGYGSILLQGHLPSDVVGGYLMAGLWGLMALSGLGAIEARRPPQPSQPGRAPRLPPVAALSSVFALAVAGTLLALTRGPHQPAPRAFIGCAIGIALVAVVVIYVVSRFTSDLELRAAPRAV